MTGNKHPSGRQIRATLAPLLGAGTLLAGFLLLYIRTAAPSVLSGDSAEFQFAAPLLAVPHPTGYPLYMLLGFLASCFPGDIARRVTLVSALCAALCVALLFLLAWQVLRSLGAAAISALALGLSPGLWNAATLAEVYALNALLIAALGHGLVWATKRLDNRGLAAPTLVGLLCGLGISHHSSFAFSAAPLAAAYALAALRHAHRPGRVVLALACGGATGLSPWLFPLIQFARFGPFDGADHGLPRFYFWGAPQNWGEALAHLAGGALRSDAVQPPTARSVIATLQLIAGRIGFEFGPLGVVLGIAGCLWLLYRSPLMLVRSEHPAWVAGIFGISIRHAVLRSVCSMLHFSMIGAGALWVISGTMAFLALLGPDVQDAPVFTLPIMLSWGLWLGCGSLMLAQRIERLARNWAKLGARGALLWKNLALVVCLVLTLAWGYSRQPYADKSGLWLFRSYGENVLERLAPNAALITRWEQGTTLHYLILVEQHRPDVWVDIVEPGDEPWAMRARRYAGKPVYFLGHPADVAGIQAHEVWAHDYASLYRLK